MNKRYRFKSPELRQLAHLLASLGYPVQRFDSETLTFKTSFSWFIMSRENGYLIYNLTLPHIKYTLIGSPCEILFKLSKHNIIKNLYNH